ncbi:MAG: hypothetical protein ACRDOD_14360 [Streptosporangiaceae bacterium]
MNPETVDSEYAKLEQEVQATGQAIQAFAQKLQTAAAAGDSNAKDWLLDLKSIAVQVQQDQLQMQSLMQAVHDFTVSHLSDSSAAQGGAAYPPPQPVYAPQPTYAMQQPMGGGMFGRFMHGGFGRAIAMGAGFGIGDDIINSIF